MKVNSTALQIILNLAIVPNILPKLLFRAEAQRSFLFRRIEPNAQASRQTGPCWLFLFKLRFPALGAISVHAHFSRPVEASYC
jgi:hypothetical protein